MPFDPSGNFTRVHNWQEDRDNGIRILADRHDEEDDNFADGFNQVFLRTGTVPMTGNLVMNGYKITSIAAGSETVPSLTWELSNNTGWWQPSPNALAVSTQGVKRLEVNNSGIVVPLKVASGNFEVIDPADADNHNTYFSRHATLGPIINFDGNDYIAYDTVNDIMGFCVGGASEFQIWGDHLFSLPSHHFGDGNHRLETPAIGPYHIFDSGDYLRYQRAINIFDFVIDEQIKMSIGPTSTVTTNWITAAGFTSAAGVFVAPNGDAANPAYRFQDNDSGLFSGGDGSVAISTNAVSRLSITGDGWATFTGNVTGQQTIGASIQLVSPRISLTTGANYYGDWVYQSDKTLALYYNRADEGAFSGAAMYINHNAGPITMNLPLTVNHNISASLGVYAQYIKSYGEIYAENGLLRSRGSGLSAGVQIINSTVGHDFRIIAKDLGDAALQITNESGGFAYVGFAHTGNIQFYRVTSFSTDVHVNGWLNANAGFTARTGAIVENAALTINGGNGELTIADRGGGVTWKEYVNFNSLTFWESSGGDAWHMQNDRYFRPAIDAAFAVGHPSFRMNAVYCVSSAMQTCDEREKDWLGELTEAELAFGRDLMKEVGTFRWKDGMDDNAVQIGVRAQRMITLMAQHGLDWNDYGFIGHDEWEETTSSGEQIGEDKGGHPIYKQIVHPAGDRYSVRLPELSLFMMAAQEQRIAALEGG